MSTYAVLTSTAPKQTYLIKSLMIMKVLFVMKKIPAILQLKFRTTRARKTKIHGKPLFVRVFFSKCQFEAKKDDVNLQLRRWSMLKSVKIHGQIEGNRCCSCCLYNCKAHSFKRIWNCQKAYSFWTFNSSRARLRKKEQKLHEKPH